MINVKDITWSFSSLNSYYTCPYSWYLKKVEKKEDEGSHWGVGGGAAHDTLEEVLKGNLAPEHATSFFVEHCPILTFPTMKEGYADRWVSDTLKFFDNLPEFLKTIKGEVVGIEEDSIVEIEGYKLRCIVDLVLKENNSLIAWDWKSSAASQFTGKKLAEKAKQLYLYSRAVKEIHGKYPDKLVFYLFREQKKIEIPFSRKDYNKTVKWMTDTINKIANEKEWQKSTNFFFCKNICGLTSCPNNGNYINK